MSKPSFYKTCLISYNVIVANTTSFSFDISNQIPLNQKYDEIKVNYISFFGIRNTGLCVNIYCPELRQYIGTSFDDGGKRLTPHDYKLSVSNLQIQPILTFQRHDANGASTVFGSGDEIAIMLTFIKH